MNHPSQDRTILHSESICSLIAQCLEVPCELITPETLLVEDLGVDSIDILAIAVNLEKQFEVVIPDDELIHFRSIRDAIACMESLCEAQRLQGALNTLPTAPLGICHRPL